MKLRNLIFLFLIGSFFFLNWDKIAPRIDYWLGRRCDVPISYRIGRVDPGYQISREEFLSQTELAAAIWSQALGKNLFTHHPEAELTVNLIYSQRQSILDQLEAVQVDLDAGRASLQAMEAEYKRLVEKFEVRLEEFNRRVDEINAQGGALPPVYQRLLEEQATLNAEAKKINALAEKLNLNVKNYNFQVSQFNQGVETYNLATQEKPEAGLYDGSVPKIDIYLTVSEAELVHTLAHEFGHALELKHLPDPDSIMHLFSSETLTPSVAEVAALNHICQESNLFYWWRREAGPFLHRQLLMLQSWVNETE